MPQRTVFIRSVDGICLKLNSLCNIIVYTTSNPSSYCILSCQTLHQSYISLHSSPPNNSIFLCPIFPHYFAPIPPLPSPPICLSPFHPSPTLPPTSFHPSPTCSSPISRAIFYLAPSPSSRIYTPPHPINLFISYSVIITLIQTNYYSNFIQHLIISHI